MNAILHLKRLASARSGIAAAGVVVLLAAGSGVAYAYWSTTGTGSGASGIGNLQVLTTQALVQPALGQQSLAPGSVADAVVRVSNPNPYAVQLYSVASAGSAIADASHPQCVTTGVTFQNPMTPISPTVTIAAGSSQTVSLPGTVSMDLTSDPGCQGATFSLPLTLEVRK